MTRNLLLLALWMAGLMSSLAAQPLRATPREEARNVILMIGDGMGIGQITAGLYARGELELMRFSHLGLITTHALDSLITDSAAGATAMACCRKARVHTLAVDTLGYPMQTLLELAHAKGLGTGVIATSTIQDATPAAFYSHQPSRLNYEEITEDFLEGMVDLAIGGGRRLFVDRRDGRNILDELEAEGYGIARNLRQARRMAEPRMMVITATGHLSSASRRNGYLPEATAFAAGHLQRQYRKGFFLMVEGSQIDFGGHSNDADYLVPEFLDFDQAVGAALDFAEQDGHTLVVVTADHETGGMSLVNGLPEQPETHEIGFITERHTAAMVPVFAYGPGAELFTGIYDNTGICYRLKAALGW